MKKSNQVQKTVAEHVKEKPEIAGLFSIQLLAVTGLAITSFVGFLFITRKLKSNKLAPFETDVIIMNYLNSISNPGLTKFMKFTTNMSSPERISTVAATMFGAFLFSKKNKIYSLEIPVVSLGSIILNLLLKSRYHRDRPTVNHQVIVRGYSYPSGHAMESSSFYGFLIYLTWKHISDKTLVIAITFILLGMITTVGISRSYLGVHYPSDVAAGYAAGLFWLVTSLVAIYEGEKYFKNNQPEKALSASSPAILA